MTSTLTRPVDNVVITTKGPQDRNIHILDGTTVEKKGKLIMLTMFSIIIQFLGTRHFQLKNLIVKDIALQRYKLCLKGLTSEMLSYIFTFYFSE